MWGKLCHGSMEVVCKLYRWNKCGDCIGVVGRFLGIERMLSGCLGEVWMFMEGCVAALT